MTDPTNPRVCPQVPSYFALITRALIVLEGIALIGNPNFDLFEAAFPFARRRALRLFGTDNAKALAQTHGGDGASVGCGPLGADRQVGGMGAPP